MLYYLREGQDAGVACDYILRCASQTLLTMMLPYMES